MVHFFEVEVSGLLAPPFRSFAAPSPLSKLFEPVTHLQTIQRSRDGQECGYCRWQDQSTSSHARPSRVCSCTHPGQGAMRAPPSVFPSVLYERPLLCCQRGGRSWGCGLVSVHSFVILIEFDIAPCERLCCVLLRGPG